MKLITICIIFNKNSNKQYFLKKLFQEFPIEETTLANTFYALIASLNKSVDLNHAGIFVRDFLIVNLAEKDLMEIYCPDEPFEIINQILAKDNKEAVEPRIIGQSGRRTIQRVYHIGLYSEKNFISSGKNFIYFQNQNIKFSLLRNLKKLFIYK